MGYGLWSIGWQRKGHKGSDSATRIWANSEFFDLVWKERFIYIPVGVPVNQEPE